MASNDVTSQEGPVSVVRFSPDEQFLAVVAGGGYLAIWELRLSDSGVCKVCVCLSLSVCVIQCVLPSEDPCLWVA